VGLPVSILDLSPVGGGVGPTQAIRDSIALAIEADRLGFTRYWVAEHHNMASIATSAPEVLIAHIAAVTTRIRVGAGGIMVPNHSPLHVVEAFRTLEALHPGRIDLGLGRAPGTDPVTSRALRRTEDPHVNEMLAELLAFEHGHFPPAHPYHAITAMPSDIRLSSIWMLGSTMTGAAIAATLGLPFAFAGHFAMKEARHAIERYKLAFEPSPSLASPYAMIAVTCVCGEDEADALRVAAPMRVAIVKHRTGRREPILGIDEALAYPFTPDERVIADEFLEGAIIDGPARAATRLRDLARDVGADEVMLSTLVPSLESRRASLQRLARELL